MPTAVLGLEAIDAPENIAAEVTDALRQRVSATRGLQLVQGKDLIELKLVFSCADEAPGCMAQAGKSLGASKLIFGSVKRSGPEYVVTLKMLDVNKATVESWTSDNVPRRKPEAAQLRALAPRWVAKLTGRGGAGGTLEIRSNVAGAVITIDGVQAGVTTAEPTILSDVAAGRHELTLEKAGYAPVSQETAIVAGQTVSVDVKLSTTGSSVSTEKMAAEATEAPMVTTTEERDAGSSRAGARTGFWIGVVGALTSAGLAIKFGTDVLRINRELDVYRRFPCDAPSGICNNLGEESRPLTDTQRAELANKNDEGNRAQTLQWVFVGLGSACGLASGYLFYRGFVDSDDAAPRSAASTLRIFPVATASSGSVFAEFRF